MSDDDSKDPWLDEACQTCHGTGHIVAVELVRRGAAKTSLSICRACNGTGRKPKPKS